MQLPTGGDVEPVTPLTSRPLRRTLLSQFWADLCFLHWPVDPGLVAPLLPAGTRPDTLDGMTYVGLIGFRMVGLGLFRGPGLPWVGTFAETNVRLYSVDGHGRRGVVFRSLDATRLLAVLTARVTLRLPYAWSRMSVERHDDEITYRCRRRWPEPRGAASTMRIRVGQPVDRPTPLDHFLTARWGLHTAIGRRTVHLPNAHPTWPLWTADLLELDDQLVAAGGLPAPVGPPVSVRYSPGVPVTFGSPDVCPPLVPVGT
ncbi:DUF2071 domain-containing protein [Microlunatus aurantiacus]|uniref:DUF2071 domain-containing protein n=1 Tax=Microlunatus aurantiacus TaxID=446786 RepID=A0ABP7CUY3_9ACTN